MLAIAGYVFAWMRLADRRQALQKKRSRPGPSVGERPQPTRRFALFAAAFLLLFVAASPLYLESAGVLALAAFIARAAASILSGVGVSAHAAANVLWTPRGGFLVTQECISTPLLPVYLAAICTCSTTWRRLILGVVAAAPLFIALGIVRLLVVALPAAVVASPLFLVHAFYQLLLGAVVVLLAALWRHGQGAALRHALVGLTVGVGFVYLLGPFYTRVVAYPAGPPLEDRRARSRSFPLSRSASISRSGSRRSWPSVGSASSPGSRPSNSHRQPVCSHCTPSPAIPGLRRTCATSAAGRWSAPC